MRRLVICADGTWNTAEAECPTNVDYMARAIRPVARDGASQVVLYHAGVGTGPWLDRFTGGAFGAGIDNNIKDIYRWLVHNYQDGDQLFLFGFSRGAYTVRSLVGMLRKCGLLEKVHADKLTAAYEIYRKRDDLVDGPEATGFRNTYSIETIEIDFLGVWDTVGALGIPLTTLRWLTRQKYQFHDAQLSKIVRRAYHAMAIDERRGAFEPTLWETRPGSDQLVEQTWFTGVHSDLGGGYPDRGLADISLAWMAKRAAAAGLELDTAYLRTALKLDLSEASSIDRSRFSAMLHDSRTGFYRFTAPYDRPIGTDPGGEECVWHTAKDRLDAPSTKYSPANLVDYLSEPGAKVKGPDEAGTIGASAYASIGQ